MTDKEVGDLTPATAGTGAELFHGVQGGNSREFTMRDIAGLGRASKSADYTVVGTDFGNVIECTATLTLTLTAAATLGSRWFFLVRANGGNVTVDPNGAETIDSLSTLTVSDGSTALIVCDGTAFHAMIITLPQANQAAIEAETNQDTYIPPDLLKHNPGVVKFWIDADTSGGINDSHNVTSISDDAAGRATVTIATDFSSANWCVLGMGGGPSYMTSVNSQAAGTVSLVCVDDSGNVGDPAHGWFVGGLGDQ